MRLFYFRKYVRLFYFKKYIPKTCYFLAKRCRSVQTTAMNNLQCFKVDCPAVLSIDTWRAHIQSEHPDVAKLLKLENNQISEQSASVGSEPIVSSPTETPNGRNTFEEFWADAPVDLHMHLLELGDAAFWISLIQDKIPEIFADADGEHMYVEAYRQAELPTHATCLTAHPLSADEFAAAYPESKGTTFTYDVVYDLKSIARALGQEVKAEQTNEQLQSQIANRLPVKGAKNWQRGLVHTYTVWNARTQKFESRLGITNTDLCVMLEKDTLRTEIENFFQMKGDHQHQRETSWKHFDPQFFPRGYMLKECIYSQYPVVLDLLLDHVLSNHEQTGAVYVEFSVDFGDLIERPWIFKHLVAPSVPAESGGQDKRYTATIRYLAAFNRDADPDQATIALAEKIVTEGLDQWGSWYHPLKGRPGEARDPESKVGFIPERQHHS